MRRLLPFLCCVAVLLPVTYALTQDPAPRAIQANIAVQKWEYHTLVTSTQLSEGEKELSRLGQAGWELVSVCPIAIDSHSTEIYYYLKRPI